MRTAITRSIAGDDNINNSDNNDNNINNNDDDAA